MESHSIKDTALSDLRRRLSDIDRRLLCLVAERKAVSGEVARVKRATGSAIRDHEREREVILRARATARELGFSPAIAEELLRLMIRASLATQEQSSVAAHAVGTGQRALVIGGCGNMGGWFVEFLTSQGFEVEVADPRRAATRVTSVDDWRRTDLKHDYIVLATPLGMTDAILRDLAMHRPSGVIFDVGSLKSPLRQGLLALKSQGCQVTSVNPMFGPDTELLCGCQVVFVDLGCAPALRSARALFSSTMVEQVVMSLEDHDRLVAYVLGLAKISSIALVAQLDMASLMAEESVQLRYAMRSLNDRCAESLESLAKVVESMREAMLSQSPAAFAALLRSVRDDRAQLQWSTSELKWPAFYASERSLLEQLRPNDRP